jgi:cytochrome c oxidase subunit IV
MSNAHHDSPDHVPHITPMSTYMKTFGTLMFLTVVTVGVSYINLGTTVNLAIAVIIATIKASVVAAFFMHLAVDSRFNSMAFASSVVFLGIFVGFTLLDTSARGMFDPVKKNRVVVTHGPNNTRTWEPFANAPAPAPSAAPVAVPAAPAH